MPLTDREVYIDLLFQGQSVPKHPDDKRWKIFWKYVHVTAEKNDDVTDSYAE